MALDPDPGEAPARAPTPIPSWLLASVALVLIAVIGGGTALYRVQERQVRSEAEARLAAIARLKADQIVQWREEQIADAGEHIESIVSREAVRRLLAGPDGEAAQILLGGFRRLQTLHRYADVLLVSPAGEVMLSASGFAGPLHSEAVRTLAAAIRERRPMLTELHAGPGGLPPHVEAVAPIFASEGAAGEALGAMLLRSEARQFLYPVLQSWPIPTHSAETFIVRREADAVLFLSELRYRPDAPLKLRVPLAQGSAPAVMAVLGREGLVRGKDYRGVDVLAAVKPIPDSSWFMVAKIDFDEAQAGWREQGLFILLAMFGLLAAALASLAALWQRSARARDSAVSEAQLALAESRRRAAVFASLIERSSQPIGQVFPDGRIGMHNAAFPALLGYSREEFARLDWIRDLTPPEWRDSGLRALAELERSGNPVRYEKEYLRKDGSRVPVEVFVHLDRDEHGAPVSYLGFVTDISARRRAEEELRRTNRALRLLSEGNQALVRSTDEPGLLNEICTILVELGGYAMAWVGIAEHDAARSVRPVAYAGRDAAAYLAQAHIAWAEDEHGRGPTGSAIRSGGPVISHYLRSDPAMAPWRAAALARGYESSMALPLRAGGQVLGALNLYAGEPAAFHAEEVPLLAELADDMAFGMLSLRTRAAGSAAEQEVRKLSLAVAQSPNSIVITGLDGGIEYVNDACLRVSGYAREELLGQNPRLLASGDTPAEAYRAMWAALVAGKPWQGEFINRRKNGETYVELAHVAPIREPDGRITHYLAIKEDITERKRLEQELHRHRHDLEGLVAERTVALQAEVAERRRAEEHSRELNDRLRRHARALEEANRELESFSYTVSHDLRAPLRAINGFSTLLREQDGERLPPDSREMLERVVAATVRMGQLIDDILEYSRVGRAQMNCVAVDAADLVREVVAELQPDWPATEVIVQPLPVVSADPAMLRQIFANLIGNAFKFSGRSAAARIEIGVELAAGEQTFYVRDNGAGFDMRFADKLFGMFQRMHGASEFPGTGVGLSIVKRLVERHGGQIRAEAAPGAGATFRFTLGE